MSTLSNTRKNQNEVRYKFLTTTSILPMVNDLNHSSNEPFIPQHCNFLNSRGILTKSKALFKSMESIILQGNNIIIETEF